MARDLAFWLDHAEESAVDGLPEIRDRVIAEEPDFVHEVDIIGTCEPGARRPAALYCHGGGYTQGHQSAQRGLLRFLVAELDLVVVSTHYPIDAARRHPRQTRCCANALRWLREHAAELGVDPASCGAIGSSAGAYHAALCAVSAEDPELAGGEARNAHSARPDWLVSLWGPLDFVARWFGNGGAPGAEAKLLGTTFDRDPAAYHRASVVTHVHPGAPPALFVQGVHDPVVHRQQGTLGRAAWRAAGCEADLVEVDYIGHERIERADEIRAFTAVRDWLAARVRPQG